MYLRILSETTTTVARTANKDDFSIIIDNEKIYEPDNQTMQTINSIYNVATRRELKQHIEAIQDILIDAKHNPNGIIKRDKDSFKAHIQATRHIMGDTNFIKLIQSIYQFLNKNKIPVQPSPLANILDPYILQLPAPQQQTVDDNSIYSLRLFLVDLLMAILGFLSYETYTNIVFKYLEEKCWVLGHPFAIYFIVRVVYTLLKFLKFDKIAAGIGTAGKYTGDKMLGGAKWIKDFAVKNPQLAITATSAAMGYLAGNSVMVSDATKAVVGGIAGGLAGSVYGGQHPLQGKEAWAKKIGATAAGAITGAAASYYGGGIGAGLTGAASGAILSGTRGKDNIFNNPKVKGAITNAFGARPIQHSSQQFPLRVFKDTIPINESRITNAYKSTIDGNTALLTFSLYFFENTEMFKNLIKNFIDSNPNIPMWLKLLLRMPVAIYMITKFLQFLVRFAFQKGLIKSQVPKITESQINKITPETLANNNNNQQQQLNDKQLILVVKKLATANNNV